MFGVRFCVLISLFLVSCGTGKEVVVEKTTVNNGTPGALTLEGHYQGKNLYIQNPFDEQNRFCTYRVTINDSIELDSADYHSSAYMIDFPKYGFSKGDKVIVKIYHYPNCMPKALNPVVH